MLAGKMIDGACGRDRCAVEAWRLNETRPTEVFQMRGFAGARLASLAQWLLRCYNSGAAVGFFAHSRRVAR
jgi:hypothetical protein